MKTEIPLLYYQPNDCFFLEKSISLNSKYFKNIFVLKEPNYFPFENIYKHMSSNSEPFEKLCFIRFFCMLNFIKQNKIDKFVYCDTDAIFLESVDYENILGKDLCVACKPEEQSFYEQAISAHFSIWTLNGLESFCNFLMETYSNNINLLIPKWEWHLMTKNLGGICDMTLLYHWYKTDNNLLKLRNDFVFDRNINDSSNNKINEFLMNNGLKNIIIENEKAYGFNKNNQKIQFAGLHFQGVAKNLILSL